MPVEFVGMINAKDVSETRFTPGPPIDVDYTRRFIVAHEHAGFDKVLINSGSPQPDGMQLAAFGAGVTERLGFLVSHRPGFLAPTLAARTLVDARPVRGRPDRDPHHHRRLRRGDGARRRPLRQGRALRPHRRVPRYPQARLDVGHAVRLPRPLLRPRGRLERPALRRSRRTSRSTSAAPPTPPTASAASTRTCTRSGASRSRRPPSRSPACAPRPRPQAAPTQPRISVSFRPILGPTEELAWERAHRILAQTTANFEAAKGFGGLVKRFVPNGPPPNAGSQRLLAAAEAGELHDRCLWTPLAAATGAAGNSTALVGTPETVAQAILDYVDIGVSTILIRGYDPYDDAIDYGRELIPLVRSEVARRDAARRRARRRLRQGSPMPIEFIGLISTKESSETRYTAGPPIDREYTRRITRAHEDSDFDKVLIGSGSFFPEATQVAAYAAQHSERLGFLVSHRPGFIAPTVAARIFATLDVLAGGRIALHTITGGSDAEMAARRRPPDEGRALRAHRRVPRRPEARLDRRHEPFDYEGTYYTIQSTSGPTCARRSRRASRSTSAARPTPPTASGAKHADTYAVFGEPLAETAEQIARIRSEAAAAGRETPPGISVSFRPILGATEELAWERAHRILERRRRTCRRRASSAGLHQALHARQEAEPRSARSGCAPPSPRASCTTAACGRRSPA